MIAFLQRTLTSFLKFIFFRVIILGLIMLFIVTISGVSYDLYKFLKTPVTVVGNEQTFEITSGMSINQLGKQLKGKGVITNVLYFEWYGRLTGQAKKLQVGEYRLKKDMYPQDIVVLVSSGKVVQYSFTIVEGWTFDELRKRLAENENITHTLSGLTNAEVMTALDSKGKAYEGYFLPDTYFFPKNYNDIELLKRSYSAMQDVVNNAWKSRDLSLPISSVHELLTLASIVEKESGIATERPKIAGVFVRRLQKNMRLQTDPTIIYGLGENYKGTIYKSDLQLDTPYNTYMRAGLPPTPIAMPSSDAIFAAANPESGDALYFVAKGDGSGEHIFSATYEEHQKAVKNYRQRVND